MNGCEELFISEYVEGSGKNRAIEIFNPSDTSKDLSPYSVKVFSNGPNNPDVTQLSGVLPSETAFSCSHDQADQRIRAKCDITSNDLKFDGDDAVGLYKNDTLLDIIGEIGVNPGNTGWQVGIGFTKDHTLKRGYNVEGSTPYWNQSVFEWDILEKDTTRLASHRCACRGKPEVEFSNATNSIIESGDLTFVQLKLSNQVSNLAQVRICKEPTSVCADPPPDADCGPNEDFTVSSNSASIPFSNACPSKEPCTQSSTSGISWVEEFPSGSTLQEFTVKINDDLEVEQNEFVCFSLSAANGQVTEGDQTTHMLEIENNDVSSIQEESLAGIKVYPTLVET